MSDPKKSIPVLDPDNRLASYTTPAKARILTTTGKARVFNKTPFIIQMTGDMGVIKVAAKTTSSSIGMIGNSITNFTKYFAVEREVYVQNMGSTQISLRFPNGMGEEVYVTIPRTRKPFNLTQHVEFAAIKRSTDFKKIINRRPPVMRLIEEEEFINYYAVLAERNGTSIDAEVGAAQDLQAALMNKSPVTDAMVDTLKREMEISKEKKIEELEQAPQLHPRIVGLCADADPEQGAARISSGNFIEELESLEAELTPEDWEFVSSKGCYKTVKKFAAQKLDALLPDTED